MKFLLDSVILIDHFNQIQQSTEYLLKNRQECAISVITRAEVLTGFKIPYPEATQALLDSFPLLEFTAANVDLVARLRQEYKWKLPDAIQAAIAKYHNLKLITRNTKDFGAAHADFVVIPYHL
ncbi:type II toxin-antitoxin system VapC family toxin [soil metagenome]